MLVYYDEDPYLREIAAQNSKRLNLVAYREHPSEIAENQTWLLVGNRKFPLRIFGRHNLQNLSGAKILCNKIGITDDQFYEAVSFFKGAARRLEVLAQNKQTDIFRDFAHSPSKLKATIEAVKIPIPRQRIDCLYGTSHL